MNRWRVRLAELQSNACAPPEHVQNVQLFKSHPLFLVLNILNNLNSDPSRC